MQPVVARFKGGDREAGSEPAEEPQQQQQEESETTTDDMKQQHEPTCDVCDAAAGLARGGVPVVFELGKHCAFGNSFAITGEAPGLGAWDPQHAARMEWSEGDVWRVSVPLPIDSPIAFKYIELGPDGGLVGWGQDLCAGSGNMAVLVERAQDFVTGFTVTLDPPMPTASDVAVDAADPSPATQPYLAARLDIAAVLPLSSAFFQRKALAVAAGLPSTKADDLVTDAALAEQGLLSQRQLADKWGQQGLELLGMTAGSNEGSSSRLDGTSALAGAAAAGGGGGGEEAGGLGGGYADAGSLGAAVAGGLMEAGDDETAAGGGIASSAQASKAAGRMMTSMDYNESGASSAAEDGSSSKFDTSADDEGDWVPPGPPAAAAAPGSSSSSSGQQGAMGGLTIKPMQPPGSPQPPYVVCKPPPAGSTKLVSAGPSVESIDVDVPLNHAGRAVTEVPAGGELQPLDPLGGAAAEDEGDQPVQRPASSSAAEQQQPASPTGHRVKITTDQGMSVSMRGADPLSLPDAPEVAAMRGAQGGQGFVDSETALAPDEGLLVPPEATAAAAGEGVSKPRVKITADQGMSVSMRGEDPLSLPDAPEVAAMRSAQGGQGFVDSETALGPDEGLLVPPGATAAAAGNSSGSSSKPRVKITTDQGMSVSMRGEDPLSLPDAPEVAAMRGAESPAGFVDIGEALQPDEGLLVPADLAEPAGTAAAAAAGGGGTADVQTPAGAKHEAEGFGSHEVLLAPAEQAQAAGLAAQAEGLDEPTATLSVDDERLAAGLAAAAAAAAASVRYAGGAAAAEVQEAAEAVDARNALLQGPGAEPVQQIMAEAQGIADAARSGAEALQQQQQQQGQEQQAAGPRGGRVSKRGGWLKRWITGE
uniref:CBM20 domain-containing protein n=1 Tax=Tetradesmus obliquus TaxID=3088 RepID=A0A383W2G5_TETOB|eukprot:jgi/Sobl393_1/1175/SZX71343.1